MTWRSRFSRPRLLMVALGATVAGAGTAWAAGPVPAGASPVRAGVGSARACALGPAGRVKHVIYIQFDNTHFSRTNPNVPSDIEQMPALLHFMESNGTVLTDDHTPLIAHTADDLVTSLTGVYGNDQGIPEANTYLYYRPNGTTDTAGSFGYWTDPVDSYTTANGLGTDHTPNLIDAAGRMAPAPWVPYTRAGCNVGDVAMANTELENSVPDVPDVFGKNSVEAKDAANPNFPTETEFEGLSVHCAKGSTFCASNPRPVADRLPDEPGGYHGYQAVFGAKFLDHELHPSGPLTNLDGKAITDSSGHVGFPGYDAMQPVNALAFTLDMQERGIPVTYTYLTDAHDNAVTGNGMGPGEKVYEQQLASYNQAFAKFFVRLAAAGINKSNTLFVFGEDENDHFVGSAPQPAGCNGVTTPCSYTQLGEVGANLQGLLAKEKGITTPFTVNSDSAPYVYLPGLRACSGRIEGIRPLPGRQRAADQIPGRSGRAERAPHGHRRPCPHAHAHLVRQPRLLAERRRHDVLDPALRVVPDRRLEPRRHLTGHQPVLDGLRGPGSPPPRPEHRVGERDRHEADPHGPAPPARRLRPRGPGADRDPAAGRPAGLPAQPGIRAAAYTAVESPVGPFCVPTLAASTAGLASGSAGNDSRYLSTERRIAALGSERDQVGARMISLLEGAAFHNTAIPPGQVLSLVRRANDLVSAARRLGDSS